MTDARTWLIRATVPFPVNVEMPAGGGLPDKLNPVTRIVPAVRRVGGRPLIFERGQDWPKGIGDFRLEPADLVLLAEAETPIQALDEVRPVLELVVESLSFQVQQALSIACLEVLDVTPPGAPGESREMLLYPIPQGLPLTSFRRASVRMQGVAVAMYPDPGLELQQDDHRLQRALDWYLKGLAAPLQVDQFMFWWVAAELLRGVIGMSRVEPYVPKCGHALSECPECGEPTTREVLGASMQAFLVERGGLDEDTARELWRTRQIVHGNVAFDSAKLTNVPVLTQCLQAVVVNELKVHLAIAPHQPPFVDGEGLSIDPHVGMGGSRELEERDIDAGSRLTE